MFALHNKRDIMLIMDALIDKANALSNKIASMQRLNLQTTDIYTEAVRDLNDTSELVKASNYHLEKFGTND